MKDSHYDGITVFTENIKYVDGNEIPIYKKYDTEEVLDYKSLTEIDEKYISDAKTIENINVVEM